MDDIKILLVDDEGEFVTTLAERLDIRGLPVRVARNGEEALRLMDADPADVMVLDLLMPGLSGMEVLKRVKAAHPKVEVIMLTGHGSDRDRDECLRLGATGYHKKPLDIEALLDSVRAAARRLRNG